jgi:hypothetical protein
MTLLTIATNVAAAVPVAAPTFIVGNADETAVRLLSAANLTSEALARTPQGGWLAMIAEYDFFTSATASNISGTTANVGGFGVISGLTLGTTVNPMAPLTWYAFGTGLPQQAIVTAVTINDPNSIVTINQAALTTGVGQFTFGQSDYALPADFERVIDNTIWDRSRFWAMRGPQSPQQWQLYKSSVIGRASIQRRYRFREIAGVQKFSIDPVPTDNGSAMVFEYVSNAWCKSSGGAKQTSWQADTDVGILDEYLITLGSRWRMMRSLGLSYQEELDEYERQVGKAVAHDGGEAILDMTPSDRLTLIGPWNLPETGFGNVIGS